MEDKTDLIIFKNDAVGDLTHSLPAINSIIANNKNKNIIIYLSNRSRNFSFLINHNISKKVIFEYINYDLTILEKIKIFLALMNKKICAAYILAPKNFYFYLPFFFRKIKFIGVCVNGSNGYKRPSNFFRKYLYKYSINDRDASFKRDSSAKIQHDLVKMDKFELPNSNFNINISISPFLKDKIFDKYTYFHLKKNIINQLKWSDNDLDLLFDRLSNKYKNLIFTRDIEKVISPSNFKTKYNFIDFKTKSYSKKNNNIYLFENIEGEDLYNVIKNANKVVAFHGMMTNLAALEQVPVLDLFYCKIDNWNDYKNYRNSFYEFKPNYNKYDFIIPKKSITKTINKMKFSLSK